MSTTCKGGSVPQYEIVIARRVMNAYTVEADDISDAATKVMFKNEGRLVDYYEDPDKFIEYFSGLELGDEEEE